MNIGKFIVAIIYTLGLIFSLFAYKNSKKNNIKHMLPFCWIWIISFSFGAFWFYCRAFGLI